MTMTLAAWQAQQDPDFLRLLSAIGADPLKTDELQRELADHERIVNHLTQYISLLPQPPVCAWQAGRSRAIYCVVTGGGHIAPRDEKELRDWLPDLLGRIQRECQVPPVEVLRNLSLMTDEAHQLWQATRWIDQQSAQLQAGRGIGKAELEPAAIHRFLHF